MCCQVGLRPRIIETDNWLHGTCRSGLRPAVSWLGTMPDIIAFQYDVVIAAAVAYVATTEGNVSLDNLVVPSEYTE